MSIELLEHQREYFRKRFADGELSGNEYLLWTNFISKEKELNEKSKNALQEICLSGEALLKTQGLLGEERKKCFELDRRVKHLLARVKTLMKKAGSK